MEGVWRISAKEKNNCPKNEDFSPCQCQVVSSNYYLVCDEVPLANVSNIFKRNTPANWQTFYLNMSLSDLNKTIPAYFLGNHTAKHFYLYCPAAVQQKQNFLIKIDPNAFRSPKSAAIEFHYSSFEIERCDL